MDRNPPSECGHPPAQPDRPEPLMKVEQVAEWLSVSLSTLYHASSNGAGHPS